MMQAGALPKDEHGNTQLHLAAARGDVETARQLLAAHPALINAQSTRGATALFLAAQAGNTEVVKLLVDAGTDVDIANENDATPLFIAAREGHLEVVRLLLEAGADPTASNKNAVTPQDIAFRKDHTEVAALINSYAQKKVYNRSDDVLKKILKKGPKNG